jgi:cytochrome c oxidase cbb3-type subunit IV
MDWINDMRAVVTVVSFIVFIGICVWAWSAKRKSKFDEAARLPLEDDRQEPASSNNVAPARRHEP